MKNKSLYIIMIIAIILGAIIVKTKGFNYSTLYSEHKIVEIIVGKEYELKDIEKIADESIKEDHITRKATLYGTSVTIDAKRSPPIRVVIFFAEKALRHSRRAFHHVSSSTSASAAMSYAR